VVLAIAAATPALAGKPRHAPGAPQEGLGEVAQMCADAEDPSIVITACDTLLAAESLPPQDRAAALNNRGLAKEHQGNLADAVVDYDKAVETYPDNLTARLNRGAIYRAHGEFDRAIAEFEEVLARDPLNAMALNNRCFTRAMTQQRLDLALSDCDAALRLARNDPRMLDSRGFAHLVRGDDAEALHDFDAALKADPDSAHALYGRGLARIDMGDDLAGKADVARALSQRPDVATDYAKVGLEPDPDHGPASHEPTRTPPPHS
jgi:tetratricopeptide (TPR) repeat protein